MKLSNLLKAIVLILVILMISQPALCASEIVVTLGNNLNQSQKDEMLDYFEVDKDDAEIIAVTNEEERQQLEGLVSSSVIGKRAISCAYVEILNDGSGVDVDTNNITVVTEQAYANALVTAGIKDAKVKAAAPFPVSGTAALTGLFKAYEKATGKEIPQDSKEVATEELAQTATIGEEEGNPKAVSQLIQNLKEKVLTQDITDPQDLKKLIEDEAKKLGLSLSNDQIEKIISLLTKIKDLNIDISSYQKQLNKYVDTSKFNDVWKTVEQFFVNLWDKLMDVF